MKTRTSYEEFVGIVQEEQHEYAQKHGCDYFEDLPAHEQAEFQHMIAGMWITHKANSGELI